jgi:iron uptake system component EfeO
MKNWIALTSLVSVVGLAAACGDDSSSTKTDAQYKTDVTDNMHTSIATHLQDIIDGATALQAAAPTHAWDATADAAAIQSMTDAWKKTRVGYELVEGATAPIFGALDISMDERYDGFLSEIGANGDQDLFDDQGVTGMHAIERILYAPTTRQEVIDFEATLPGYKAAAWPATDAEAMEFKTKLAQKLIDDATSLHTQWQPAAIDIDAAYGGLVGLMNEQKEKVNLAATGEEESRYANITLFDLRNNLAGTKAVYALFQPWIQSKGEGVDPDAMIEAKFADLDAVYSATSGDAIPVVPDDWHAETPTAANLATPFGMIWETVHADVDPTADGSVVFEMNKIATLLGFMQFVEGP